MASVSIIFGGQEERQVTLDKPKLVVGREATCDIHIENLGISRQHCALAQRGDTYVVQDLGSSNGTYVNGRKITEHFLNNDDEIVIGKYTLKFKNETQAAPAPAQADGGVAIPDTLNTYVVDGTKIQEQLAKMRAQGQAAPTTAKDIAKAMEAPPTVVNNAEVQKLKTYIMALATVVVVLLLVIVFLLLTR